MQKKLAKLYPLFLIGLLPAMSAFAQTSMTVDTLLSQVKTTLNTVIVLLFILESVVLIFGVIRLISSAGDPAANKGAKNLIFYSVIGMAVTIAAWAIARILVNYFIGSGDTKVPDANTIIR